MSKGKNLITTKRRKMTKLNEGMSTLKISKKICRNHRTIKKVVENITKLRTLSKGKCFKNLLP